MIPALGYGFDYLTRVYTDLLSEGIPAAVEFYAVRLLYCLSGVCASYFGGGAEEK